MLGTEHTQGHSSGGQQGTGDPGCGLKEVGVSKINDSVGRMSGDGLQLQFVESQGRCVLWGPAGLRDSGCPGYIPALVELTVRACALDTLLRPGQMCQPSAEGATGETGFSGLFEQSAHSGSKWIALGSIL